MLRLTESQDDRSRAFECLRTELGRQSKTHVGENGEQASWHFDDLQRVGISEGSRKKNYMMQ